MLPIVLKPLGFLLIAGLLHVTVNAQQNCLNPNQNLGFCLSIYDCPALLRTIQKPQLVQDERMFLRSSQCDNGFGRAPFVCCTEDTNYINANTTAADPIDVSTTTQRSQPTPNADQKSAGNLLPRSPDCGPDSFGDRIYNGNDAAVDEFIWMALLEYRSRDGQTLLNCGGSLINNRYVLTAAHCVVGEVLTVVGELVGVRLGEHDISKELDCNGQNCNPPPLEMGIEEAIVHPQYDPSNVNRHHDIALIRLNSPVQLNAYIQPVCLPIASSRSAISANERLVVSGWGRTLLTRQSNIKQRLSIPATDPSQCASKFATRKITLISSQLCAGGEFSRDSCDGDSGGPLMRYKEAWYQEGVVSFGHKCGLENWPGVYTRVADYIDWIEGTIRA